MGRIFLIPTIVIAVVIFLLYVPIIVSTNVHYDMNRQKLAFSFLLYNRIQLTGGYIGTYAGGLALHTSPKKAKLLSYKDMNNQRKRISLLKGLRIVGGSLHTETGAEYLLEVGALQALLRLIFFIRGGKKERITNSVWLTDGDQLKIALHFAIYCNLYMLLCAFIKSIKENMTKDD